MRQTGIRDFGDVSFAGGFEMGLKWIQKPRFGFGPGFVGCAMDIELGYHKRADHPRPHGALMVSSISLQHAAAVERFVLGIVLRRRSQPQRS